MSNWYLDYENNKRIGPISTIQAQKNVRKNNNGHAWKEGFKSWKHITSVKELMIVSQQNNLYSPPQKITTTLNSDEIDYKIFGEDIQYVEIELDPNESVIAEVNAMMYKDPKIKMTSIFGDTSKENEKFINKVVGAGKRLLSGENLFTTLFTHEGNKKAKLAFSASYPGRIIPIDLSRTNGTIICQKDSFLCAAKGVSISIHFQKNISTGFFGGEGFIMQKLEGDGMVFMHAGGMIKKVHLKTNNVLHLDTGSLVAMESSIDFDIERTGNIKTSLLGGEGFFFARLQGPGNVWIQSLAFSRFIDKVRSSIPQRSISSYSNDDESDSGGDGGGD